MFDRLKSLVGALGFGSARPRVVSVGIEFDRQPDPAWQAALDAESPPSEDGRLVLVWDAGDRWQPIGRWSILQVQPWHLVPEQAREALLGPHPRTNAQRLWNADEQEFELVGPHIGPVDRLCWETARRLRQQGVWGLPLRWWVVQGAEGGHAIDLSPYEERLWRQQGRVFDRPGLLPYAPFDQRVIRALRPYLLRGSATERGDVGYDHARAHYQRLQQIQIASRTITWNERRAMAEQHASQLGFAMRKDGLHLTRNSPVGAPKPRPVDITAARDEYVNADLLETTA